VLGGFPPPSVPDGTWTPPGCFHFVGITRDLGPALDWTVAPTRLWGYHLHSLDALREDRPLDVRLQLLDRWMAANPFASCSGWESYPTSVRIVNAFEMLLGAGDAGTPSRAAGLALQSWWLEANLETDLEPTISSRTLSPWRGPDAVFAAGLRSAGGRAEIRS